MKIKKKLLKNPIFQNFIAIILVFYIWFVRTTSKINIHNESIPYEYWDQNKPFILAFWHSQLMMISFSWKIKKKINILASGHSDGRLGAIIGNYFKLNNIQTSKLNNNNASLRIIFEIIKNKNYIGITPDGPRGPKERVSKGIIKIAKNTKIPIIPIGFWSTRNFSLNSWDSFLVTKPFSNCSFVWGKPILIPEKINELEIEKFQIKLENEISECIEKAKKKSL